MLGQHAARRQPGVATNPKMAAKEGLLDGLDEKSQRELAAFLEEEQRRAAFQTRVGRGKMIILSGTSPSDTSGTGPFLHRSLL